MKGFTDYWIAGHQIWAGKSGASCEIDLEAANVFHALHVREAVCSAYEGKRTQAQDHRDRADQLSAIIREQSIVPRRSRVAFPTPSTINPGS